jgi:hypothetical protein
MMLVPPWLMLKNPPVGPATWISTTMFYANGLNETFLSWNALTQPSTKLITSQNPFHAFSLIDILTSSWAMFPWITCLPINILPVNLIQGPNFYPFCLLQKILWLATSFRPTMMIFALSAHERQLFIPQTIAQLPCTNYPQFWLMQHRSSLQYNI